MKQSLVVFMFCIIAVTSANQYVAFRLDDIQDFWLDNAQQAVINVFWNNNVPLTVGIIANYFGEDANMVDYIESAIQDETFDLEIANHGFNHEDFTTFSESDQLNLLTEAKAKTLGQLSMLNDIYTFVPPFDSFNANTVTAAQAAGFRTMSSDISLYGTNDAGVYSGETVRAYPGSNPNFKEFPAGSGTNDLYDQYTISVAESMEMIQNQIEAAGFSVVMMHFNWYVSEVGDSSTVNETMINMLEQLINECQSAGYTLTTIGALDSLSFATSSNSNYQLPTSNNININNNYNSNTGYCTSGSVECLSSESYQICGPNNSWESAETCQYGETCHSEASSTGYCY